MHPRTNKIFKLSITVKHMITEESDAKSIIFGLNTA